MGKIIKKRILYIAILTFVLLLIPNRKILATNYIFLGDSRTVGMVGGYNNSTDFDKGRKYVTGVAASKIKQSVKINKSFAIVGANYKTWFGNSTRLNKIKNTLQKSDSKTKVIIWLGVNDIAGKNAKQAEKIADDYITQIKKLAKSNKKLKFYYVSVTAVDSYRLSSSIKIKNSVIDAFNARIKKNITSAKLDNLTYIDINSSLKNIINSKNFHYSSDGLHYWAQKGYSGSYYPQIWERINKKI